MFCILAVVSQVESSTQSSDKHRFHECCSDTVTFSNSRQTAQRYGGLFNMSVTRAAFVLSNEPLGDDQLFEVKIDAVGNNYYPIPRSN